MKKFFIFLPFFLLFKFNSIAMESYSLNPPSGNTSYTYTTKTTGYIDITLPSSVSGTTPINVSGTIPASYFQLPSGASIVNVSLSVSPSSLDVYYGQTSTSGTNTVNRYTKLTSGSISDESLSQDYSLVSLNGHSITSFPYASISGMTSLSPATVNLRSTVGTAQSLSGGSSSKVVTVYYTWTITYKVSGGKANFYLWSSLSSSNSSSIMGFYVPNLPKYSPGLYYINLSATNFPTTWPSNTNFTVNSFGYGTSYGSLAGVTSADHSSTLGISNGIYISGYVYLNEDFSDSLVFMSSFDTSKVPTYTQGWYSTNIDIEIIPANDFNEDIVFPDIIAYPPAFPTTTGLSYSLPYSNDFYVTSFSISSNGVTIPQGYDYALVDLTYTINFNGSGNPPTGSYMLSFSAGGGTTAGWPQFFQNSSDVYLTNLKNNGIYGSVRSFTAFTPSGYYGNTIYFNVSRPEAFNSLTFIATFFVTQNIPSFNYTSNTNNSLSIIYSSDSNNILKQLQSQSNALTSAGGANSGMNAQNQLVNSALSDYQSQTDTSAQYGNISDTLFIPDVSVFTQMAPTISLFSSVITGLFTHLGDLSVPLTMFLVFVFISSVLGIHNFVVSSNDRMESKSRRSGSGKGKKGD